MLTAFADLRFMVMYFTPTAVAGGDATFRVTRGAHPVADYHRGHSPTMPSTSSLPLSDETRGLPTYYAR